MTIAHGDIEKHRQHLANVSPETVRDRLQGFRLQPGVMDVLPFVCKSFHVKSPFTEYIPWVHPLEPRSLDDLKNWFGVPNETAKQLESETRSITAGGKLWAGAARITPRALPTRHFEFESLDQEQRLAVRLTANNLLYGYVDPESASRRPLSGVIDYMIAASINYGVKIFVAPDLIVCPDDVVEFENVPALFFKNVLIYGTGQIVIKSKTKLHAVQITCPSLAASLIMPKHEGGKHGQLRYFGSRRRSGQ